MTGSDTGPNPHHRYKNVPGESPHRETVGHSEDKLDRDLLFVLCCKIKNYIPSTLHYQWAKALILSQLTSCLGISLVSFSKPRLEVCCWAVNTASETLLDGTRNLPLPRTPSSLRPQFHIKDQRPLAHVPLPRSGPFRLPSDPPRG